MFLGLRYQHLRQDKVKESGGGFANRIDRFSADSLATTLGLEFGREFCLSNGARLTPRVR